ncbi:hypothetical protein D3C76_1832960 [compost metagenome]
MYAIAENAVVINTAAGVDDATLSKGRVGVYHGIGEHHGCRPQGRITADYRGRMLENRQ